jgi:3-oxoacyl-[acyl-carrier protein] reductase
MRNIIVTGASRGIGLAIASRLARGGDRVIAIARSQTDELAQLKETTHSLGRGAVHFAPFDLGDIDGIPALVRNFRQDFGRLDGLVNNAGIGTSGLLATMHNAQIEKLFRLNIVSPAVMTKYVVRSMMTSKSGRVVNVASVIAFQGYSGLSIYAATKAASVGFTRSLAREVGGLGITVNAVAPGFMNTEMTKKFGADQRATVARRSALRRLADPEDVADAVEFLLSDKARNITGTVLTVDAGSLA